MTQVKTKFDANTSTSKITQTIQTDKAQGNLDRGPVFSFAKPNHVW